MKLEMLWESNNPEVELRRRFGFASTNEAQDWVSRVLTIRYGIDVAVVERMVISAQNLMFWVTSAASDRLLVKVCRLAEAHAWLTARSAMVPPGWPDVMFRSLRRCEASTVINNCCAMAGRSGFSRCWPASY